MATISREEYLDTLAGTEVISTEYEGVVGITGDGQLWKNGKVIVDELTQEQLQRLFFEYVEMEFGSGGALIAEAVRELDGIAD